MSITELVNFAANGEKSATGLDRLAGFPRDEKPARAWFNLLFNEVTTKVNELVTSVNALNLKEDPEQYGVNDIYMTTKNYADATAVANHFGYGEWERYAEGKTLVGLSKVSSHPAWVKTIGSEAGTYEETLTEAQIPEHSHPIKISTLTKIAHDDSTESDRTIDATKPDEDAVDGYITNAGGGEAHNNVQPSKVAAFWLRVA